MSEDGDEDAPGDPAGSGADPPGAPGEDVGGSGEEPAGGDGTGDSSADAGEPAAGEGSGDGPAAGGDETDDSERGGDGPAEADGATGTGPADSYFARLRRITDTRIGRAVVAITVLAVLGRLVLLGQRTAHWDEGRVAYWTLKYAQTGHFEYRPVVHGPFLFQVNEFLFSFVGSTDFVARLPVALVGGLLPASAWLFRERLKGSETVALAGLLALNPLLVYYSRFMRNDVLVAAFAFFAFGFVVRAYDSRNGWYAVPAGLTLALAITAKENAFVYILCWFGAAGLLLDHRLMGSVRSARARFTGSTIRDGLRQGIQSRLLQGGAVALVLALNPYVAFEVADSVSLLPYVFAGVVFFGYLVAIRDTEIWEHLAAVGVSVGLIVGLGGVGVLVLSVLAGVVVLAVLAVGAYRALARGANPWHYATAFAFVFYVYDVASGLTHLETMLAYTLFWLLVGAMLLDEALFAGGRGTARSAWTRLWEQFPPMLAAYLVTVGALVFFYAPRLPNSPGVGLWESFTRPGAFLGVVEDALLDSAVDMWWHWFAPDRQDVPYVDRLDKMVATMIHSAGLIFAFSAVGFVYDRWSGLGPRDVVAMGGYWGFVSILGYPYATDIWAPWIAVHAVVPLAIPAAVGLAGVYRMGRDSFDRGDAVTGTLVGVLLLSVLAPAAVTAVDVAYVNSGSHERVMTDLTGGEHKQRQYVLQWAQPSNGLKGTLGTVRRVAQSHEGTDVLYYGTRPDDPGGAPHLYVPDEETCLKRPPVHVPRDVCQVPALSWHSRLPLPWYLESYGAEVTSTHPGTDIDNVTDVPPVVIAFDWDEAELSRNLPDSYEAHTHPFKLWYEDIVVFVDQRAVPGN